MLLLARINYCEGKEKTMNNKRGGIGAKILLVLILMLLAAGGGAYGYRMLDGKLAVRDAQKIVKDYDIADYDTEEAAQLQVHINNVTKNLETAQTRKEVYEIIDNFKEEVEKIQTKAEKELEAAKREAEEARRANQQNNQNNQNNQDGQGFFNFGNNNNSSNNNNSGNSDTSGNSGNNTGNDQSSNTQNTENNTNSSTDVNGYKSNDLTQAEDGTENSGGLFNSLFGNNDGDN